MAALWQSPFPGKAAVAGCSESEGGGRQPGCARCQRLPCRRRSALYSAGKTHRGPPRAAGTRCRDVNSRRKYLTDAESYIVGNQRHSQGKEANKRKTTPDCCEGSPAAPAVLPEPPSAQPPRRGLRAAAPEEEAVPPRAPSPPPPAEAGGWRRAGGPTAMLGGGLTRAAGWWRAASGGWWRAGAPGEAGTRGRGEVCRRPGRARRRSALLGPMAFPERPAEPGRPALRCADGLRLSGRSPGGGCRQPQPLRRRGAEPFVPRAQRVEEDQRPAHRRAGEVGDRQVWENPSVRQHTP